MKGWLVPDCAKDTKNAFKTKIGPFSSSESDKGVRLLNYIPAY
jgi:hypothetical protein